MAAMPASPGTSRQYRSPAGSRLLSWKTVRESATNSLAVDASTATTGGVRLRLGSASMREPSTATCTTGTSADARETTMVSAVLQSRASAGPPRPKPISRGLVSEYSPVVVGTIVATKTRPSMIRRRGHRRATNVTR